MTEIVRGHAPPVDLVVLGPNRVRIAIGGTVVGPVLTRRAAAVVRRWLEGGALDELQAESGSKLARTLRTVDDAADAVIDILKNGLR